MYQLTMGKKFWSELLIMMKLVLKDIKVKHEFLNSKERSKTFRKKQEEKKKEDNSTLNLDGLTYKLIIPLASK